MNAAKYTGSGRRSLLKQANVTFTKQRDLLSDAVDIDDGPEWAADAEAAVEEDWLAIVDTVKDPPVAIGPERQHAVLQGESLGKGLGPVAGPRHQIWTSVLGDVRYNQVAGVQTGEAKS